MATPPTGSWSSRAAATDPGGLDHGNLGYRYRVSWGTFQLTSTPFYVNPTLLPGDANLDGNVDVLDLAILAANYRKHVTGGWMQATSTRRCRDVQDLAILAADYRHIMLGRRPGLR